MKLYRLIVKSTALYATTYYATFDLFEDSVQAEEWFQNRKELHEATKDPISDPFREQIIGLEEVHV